jgi:hypothetical protein
MSTRRLLCLVVIWLGAAVQAAFGEPQGDAPKPDVAQPAAAPFSPTEHYQAETVEGWRVLVHRDLSDKEPELYAQTRRELEQQLYNITRMVPAAAVEKLRKVTIWVELSDPNHPCMCYHPDRNWLVRHNMNPEKARCVELANARNFLQWTRQQPWMVLHELAHAYHHQFLDGGFDNPRVRAEFERVREEKLYDEVLHIDGRPRRGYAVTNPMEYLAENSEALFGTNDFFPFVRAELRRHDPRTFELLNQLWGAE